MSLSVDYIRFLHKKIEVLESENGMLKSGKLDDTKLPELPKEPDYSFTEYQQQKEKDLDEQAQLLNAGTIQAIKEESSNDSFTQNDNLCPTVKSSAKVLDYESSDSVFSELSSSRHIDLERSTGLGLRLESGLNSPRLDLPQLRRPFKYTEQPIHKTIRDVSDIEEVGNWPVGSYPHSFIPPMNKVHDLPPFQYIPPFQHPGHYMNNVPPSHSSYYRKPSIGNQDGYYYNN